MERNELLDLMRGVSPATGEPIRATGGDRSRVAGVDMTFSAPKLVSALWAVASPYRQAQIAAAHQKAVAGALGQVEREVQLLRSRAGGTLRWERAQTLVAAEFLHTASRLTAAQERGGVPDPQLHSHVVVVAGQRTDGRFAAVDSRELFRSARVNGAWYRAELAHHLRELGLEIEGGTGKDGRYFEVKGVPAARGALVGTRRGHRAGSTRVPRPLRPRPQSRYSWDGYTRRRADTELQNILADIRRGIWKPPQPEPAPTPAQDPTFHEFASQWFEARRHEVSARSVEDYRWALTRHLLPFFKDHRLSQITIAEVDRYRTGKVRDRERQKGRSLSNRSINATIALLAQVMETAVEYEHIQFNPARGRRRRLKVSQPTRTWLEPEQVKPLLDATVRGLRGGKTMPDPRMRALFATGVCTGLRIGELLALRWRDVSLAQGRLTVIDSKTEAGRGREIDLWPELCEELSVYKTQASHPQPEDYVFATSTGKADVLPT